MQCSCLSKYLSARPFIHLNAFLLTNFSFIAPLSTQSCSLYSCPLASESLITLFFVHLRTQSFAFTTCPLSSSENLPLQINDANIKLWFFNNVAIKLRYSWITLPCCWKPFLKSFNHLNPTKCVSWSGLEVKLTLQRLDVSMAVSQ